MNILFTHSAGAISELKFDRVRILCILKVDDERKKAIGTQMIK